MRQRVIQGAVMGLVMGLTGCGGVSESVQPGGTGQAPVVTPDSGPNTNTPSNEDSSAPSLPEKPPESSGQESLPPEGASNVPTPPEDEPSTPGENQQPIGDGKFALEVQGGFGSGRFAPGETVHVWSAVSTKSGVALPWSGDSGILESPNEWISRFVMPAKSVVLKANVVAQELQLTVEKYKGVTNRDKTVRYHVPQNAKGLVIMSHGTGGNSSYIDNTETFALALSLVNRGFAVLSTEAEEAVGGDLNGDGKARWNTSFSESNVDLKNMSALLAGFESRGLIEPGMPKFALGMSNGGAFSHFLGAVGASRIASHFPKIRLKAVVGYCADATQIYKNQTTRTPSAWYMCGREDNDQVSNAEARANEQRLRASGIETEYLENPPSPLYDERFTRVDGISVEVSKSIAEELRSAGYVDESGFLTKDADEIALAIIDPANAAQFEQILKLSESSQNRIKNQLKVLRAEHSQFADQSARNIRFFEKFL